MKKIILFIFLAINICSANAQDSILKRIIFIGDAGEINMRQDKIIPDAANHIISGITTVVYLGDNIYPNGMGLPGSANEAATGEILKAQFIPMRSKGAPVYFIPGNHDWDRMGKQGLAKIIAQGNYLAAQNDSFVKEVPANGCPGPFEINISDSLVIIAYDSEWWLFPYNKTNPDGNCDCNTKREFIDKLSTLFYKDRYKVILLASHHPFQTYGEHGGYFSFNDNFFPLTAADDNLKIPLPVIGSLYPFLRKTFVSPEDTKHPWYKDMVKQIDGVFAGFPNLIHVAGHEHGLQFIKSKQIQVVSGGGSKNTYVKKGKYALFAQHKSGYVTADLFAGNKVKFTYYVLNDTSINEGFAYTQPYTNVKQLEDSLYNAVAVKDGDSIIVQANAGFDKVSKLHRKLFGENYRKEWSSKTKLPVINLSEIKGGLTPLQRGGGKQTKSLRLVDSTGKEWVLRSVNKFPEDILPEELRDESLAKDILTDAMSAQHPYSAVIVPSLANAAGVAHSNPTIGVVAPDKNLGLYQKDFMNTVCLLEEREPGGKSDNTDKMLKSLDKDNDNRIDNELFLKARLLDLFIGDWDRHEDQWRWLAEKDGKGKKYIPIPRDRDQVLHIIDGLLPWFATLPWMAPKLHDFDGKIKKLNYYFTNGYKLNGRFLTQIGYNDWMKITNEFVADMTDDVLEKALQQLPKESYAIRHAQLLQQLKERRKNLPAAMKEYYKFLNKNVDILTSDKNELVEITDAPNNNLLVTIHKINKDGDVKGELYNKTFDPAITKEIRLYVEDGNDSIIINNHSTIKLRIIGGKGNKAYNTIASSKKVNVYSYQNSQSFVGNENRLRKHLSNDSLNIAYVPTNPYNKVIPMLDAGYNLDDGLLLGAGVKFINQGFRKQPYASTQQFSFVHSFSTDAFKITFKADWLNVIGKNDLVINAKALAPDNTQNFFGVGNNTVYDKNAEPIRYYRARFSIYQADVLLRHRHNDDKALSFGPSFQYYRFNADDNAGRFINNVSAIGSYDSAIIDKNKLYAGLSAKFINDKRDNASLPKTGAYISIKAIAYAGLNDYSKNYIQLSPSFSFYKKIDKQANVVFANRIGAGLTFGDAPFYQQQFLGGDDNLYGFRQYRFAGSFSLYNNAEARIKVAQIGNYILPGTLGLIGFYDAGKVWARGKNSSTIHQGVGGGIFFAPAELAVLQFVMGHSNEGWYPFFSLGFRF